MNNVSFLSWANITKWHGRKHVKFLLVSRQIIIIFNFGEHNNQNRKPIMLLVLCNIEVQPHSVHFQLKSVLIYIYALI